MDKFEKIQIEMLNENQLNDVNGGNCPQRAGFAVGGLDGTRAQQPKQPNEPVKKLTGTKR